MRGPLSRETLTATCSAAGAASLIVRGRPQWVACYLACRAVGTPATTPTWTLIQGSPLPLAAADGMEAAVGPILLAPYEALTLTVSGAPAAAKVYAQAIGWIADSPEELLGPQRPGEADSPVLGRSPAVVGGPLGQLVDFAERLGREHGRRR